MRHRATALLPGALLLAGAYLVLTVPPLLSWVRPLIPASMYLVAGAGILLGLRFGNVRAVAALVALALAEQALTRWAPPAAASTRTGSVGVALALLLPLNLAALAWTPQQGPRWRWARLWSFLIVAQMAGVALVLLVGGPKPVWAVWRMLSDPLRQAWPAFGRPTIFLFAVALILAGLRFTVRPRPIEAGVVWGLLACFLALGGSSQKQLVTLYLATAGLIFIVALVETSHAMAFGDELTGLPTRRAFNDLLSALGPPYAVAMVDVDHFKKFNDTHGHQTGDQLLRKVATTLKAVSGGGRAFRYGGEEFAVVFPNLTAEQASPHLETVRAAIADGTFTVRGPGRPRKKPEHPKPVGPRKQVGVTVSIGVADSVKAGAKPAAVVKAADDALYRAKRSGRNRLIG